MGANLSLFTATMKPDSSIPARCWMAPEYGLSGLAHLTVVRHDAGVDHGPGCGNLGAEDFRKLLQLGKSLLAAHSAAS